MKMLPHLIGRSSQWQCKHLCGPTIKTKRLLVVSPLSSPSCRVVGLSVFTQVYVWICPKCELVLFSLCFVYFFRNFYPFSGLGNRSAAVRQLHSWQPSEARGNYKYFEGKSLTMCNFLMSPKHSIGEIDSRHCTLRIKYRALEITTVWNHLNRCLKVCKTMFEAQSSMQFLLFLQLLIL